MVLRDGEWSENGLCSAFSNGFLEGIISFKLFQIVVSCLQTSNLEEVLGQI